MEIVNEQEPDTDLGKIVIKIYKTKKIRTYDEYQPLKSLKTINNYQPSDLRYDQKPVNYSLTVSNSDKMFRSEVPEMIRNNEDGKDSHGR